MSTISDLQRMLRKYKRSNPYRYSNLKKKYLRRDRVVLKSGYSLGEAYGNLRKCWKGYKIAKNDGDEEKMIHYAEGIQKFQCELGLGVSDFSDLGLCAHSSSSQEAIQKEDDLFDIQNESYDVDEEKNENKLKRNELVEYEDYLSNLQMGVEPLSRDDFYNERNSNLSRRPFYY